MFENIYEAESAIQGLIKNDNNCSAHFQYACESEKYRSAVLSAEFVNVDLVTYNPEHKTHFLLHTMGAKTKIGALNALYDHIYKLKETLKDNKNGYLNYTIEWGNKTDSKTRFSSFYGEDLDEIIRKFYYGKTKQSLNIFSIKLNPIS